MRKKQEIEQFCASQEVIRNYIDSEMLKSMKDVGVLVAMEDIANLKLVDINANTARQFKKPIELGDAYWITEGGIEKMKVVHQED